MLAITLGSASRKYHVTAGNCIVAEVESMLEMPGVQSNTPGVHV